MDDIFNFVSNINKALFAEKPKEYTLPILETLEGITNLFYHFRKGTMNDHVEIVIFRHLITFCSPANIKIVPTTKLEQYNSKQQQAFSDLSIFQSNSKKVVYRILYYLIGCCRALVLTGPDEKTNGDGTIFDSSKLLFDPILTQNTPIIPNKIEKISPSLSILITCLKQSVVDLQIVLKEDRVALDTISKTHQLSEDLKDVLHSEWIKISESQWSDYHKQKYLHWLISMIRVEKAELKNLLYYIIENTLVVLFSQLYLWKTRVLSPVENKENLMKQAESYLLRENAKLWEEMNHLPSLRRPNIISIFIDKIKNLFVQ